MATVEVPFNEATAIQFLQQLSNAVACEDHLGRLAGRVAGVVQQQLLQDATTTTTTTASNTSSILATAYLQAAAKQLQACHTAGRDVPTECKTAEYVHDVLQTIAVCVRKISPRSSIAATGILPVLHSLLLLVNGNEDCLVPAHCDFLQACIYAEQYRYAESHILHTWPRPKSSNAADSAATTSTTTVATAALGGVCTVETVLRYFYLRGVVHMNCRHWKLAVRCFWTCLSVPGSADAVSAIAVAAWKKLVLVQSLEAVTVLYNNNNSNNNSGGSGAVTTTTTKSTSLSSSTPAAQQQLVGGGGSTSGPLSTPVEMSAGMTSFLHTAKPPLGSRSRLQSEQPSSSPMASPLRRGPAPPEEAIDVMHVVEMESSSSSSDVLQLNTSKNGNDDDADTATTKTSRYPFLGVHVYRDLVRAYTAIDRATFDAMVQEHAGLFREDGNLGLVCRVGAALLHRQVYEMSSIYAAISLDQLASELGLSVPDVQTLLSQLGAEKAWPVQVMTPDGGGGGGAVVAFPSAPPLPDSDAATTTSELVQLTRMVQLLDAAVASSSKYSAVVRKELAALKTDMSGGPRGVEDV